MLRLEWPCSLRQLLSHNCFGEPRRCPYDEPTRYADAPRKKPRSGTWADELSECGVGKGKGSNPRASQNEEPSGLMRGPDRSKARRAAARRQENGGEFGTKSEPGAQRATACRPVRLPRGDVERSETAASEKMAERKASLSELLGRSDGSPRTPGRSIAFRHMRSLALFERTAGRERTR